MLEAVLDFRAQQFHGLADILGRVGRGLADCFRLVLELFEFLFELLPFLVGIHFRPVHPHTELVAFFLQFVIEFVDPFSCVVHCSSPEKPVIAPSAYHTPETKQR